MHPGDCALNLPLYQGGNAPLYIYNNKESFGKLTPPPAWLDYLLARNFILCDLCDQLLPIRQKAAPTNSFRQNLFVAVR